MASSALSKELLEPELLYQFEPKKWAEKIEYNSTQKFLLLTLELSIVWPKKNMEVSFKKFNSYLNPDMPFFRTCDRWPFKTT